MNFPKIINKFIEVPYSFTLTVPARKKVYYDKRRRVFCQMSLSQQCNFLNNLLLKVIWQEHFNFIDWTFERHEATPDDKLGRLHIHGFAIVKKSYEYLAPLHLLCNSFYTHNKIIGLSPNVYPRLCDIQQTTDSPEYWYEYIHKHNQDMPYKSPYNSQKFLINSMDNPFALIISNEKNEVQF